MCVCGRLMDGWVTGSENVSITTGMAVISSNNY